MAVISTGQITIIDYNDALSLTGFIGSNHPKIQAYNPDNATYTPDWAANNLVLTPSLFIIGDSNDLISQGKYKTVTWYEGTSATAITNTTNYAISGATLTVKTNVLSNKNQIEFVCEMVYTDANTGLDLKCKTSISFGKTVNGTTIAGAFAFAPNGNIFKNNSASSLIAECDLWRGSNIDTTLVTYQWYYQDANVTVDEGGGLGWRKITSTNANGLSGYTTRQMTIPSTFVNSYEIFKCVITDTDASSPTNNTKFSDVIAFSDLSDPIQVNVVSSGGSIFKNGAGSTTLTAKLFQAGAEIDTVSPYQYTYKWYKYDKNSTLFADFGGTGVAYKTGKTLSVGDADVDTKATFVVEIE